MAIFLFLLFIVLPLVELYVIIQVGQLIGVWPTLGLLLAGGFVGAALARSQGRAVWRRFNEAMSAGRIPGREVFDGAMIIFGGALLLSPGFITDILGIFLLIPPGRQLIRGLLKRVAARTPTGRPLFFIYDRMPGTGRRAGRRQAPGPGGAADATPPPRPASRSYDVEGSAQEIGETPGGLGRGSEGDGAAGSGEERDR